MENVDEDLLRETAVRLMDGGADVIRLSYPDIIGADRGRDILLASLSAAARDGVAFCRSAFATSPMGDVVPIDGGLADGLPDVVAFPDLTTVRHVPWDQGVAHVIADVYDPDGTPSAISPRAVLKDVVGRFTEFGQRPVVAAELEYYLLEPDARAASGWRRYGEATGNVYVAGRKGDPDNSLLRTLRLLHAYDIGAYAANHEFASGQFEINLWHTEALSAADNAFRFKSAVKELARLDGRMATFMAKPFNDEGGSGFHIHLSLYDDSDTPLFDDPNDPDGLSQNARHAIGGVIAHAPGLTALCNPTVNSYKRFGPDTLAPWLIDWGLDNRSAMLRVPPERGRASRVELRLGDASANPYLAIAALLAAAYLGISQKIEPPPALVGYGYDTSKAERLPADLNAALTALEADTELTEMLGPQFTAAFLAYKRNELDRMARYVTDWEFREYAYHL